MQAVGGRRCGSRPAGSGRARGGSRANARRFATRHQDDGEPVADVQTLGRRAAITLGLVALSSPEFAQAKGSASEGDWTTPGLAAPLDDNLPKFRTGPSGVKIQELAPGSGNPAQVGDKVLFDYILRRSNGYFIYGTVEGVSFQPKDVPVGPVAFRIGRGEIIEGLDSTLLGARAGARLRVLVPPEVGYVDPRMEPRPPTYASQRQVANHNKEPLLFELQILRVLAG